MKALRILVVGAERRLTRMLQHHRNAEVGGVDMVHDALETIRMASRTSYNLIIFDLVRLGPDCVTIIKLLRRSGITAPMLLLAPPNAAWDATEALDAGADDYLLAPFSFEMLRTFIQVLARRPAELIDTLRIADLELDPVHRRVTRAGTAIALTSKEYALLEYLMRNAGRSVTRKMLLENVWSPALDVLPHAVDAGISRLRSKIHDVTGTKLIHTIRGVGYLLAEETSEDRGAA